MLGPRPRALLARRPALAAWVAVAIVLVGLWLGGFLWFAAILPKAVEDATSRTDGIVVLTGGSERLETGLDLLEAGLAERLFISGAGRGTSRHELQRLSQRAPGLFDCCVDIGREALNTHGNAVETMRWARAQAVTSLRLVTAGYHMPRSLAEFRRAMPDVAFVANPVFPPNVKLDSWWVWPGTTLLIAMEFNKYLVSEARALFTPPR